MDRKVRILVVGDAMLDTYIYGKVSRISPEAPIPVVCPAREEHRPGGAANVACNAAALGADVTAVFVLGNDDSAEQLEERMRAFGIDANLICHQANQQTISKVRLIGNGQQIARIDLHDRYRLNAAMEEELLARVRHVLREQDAIVLSDYDKGTCTERICQEIILMGTELEKPVIVDPKGTMWEKYRGAFVVTPNLKELNLFCGRTVPNDDCAIEAAFHGLCGRLGIQHLLLTRSERGMSLLDDTSTFHVPTQAQEVNDVSGAGDTAVAALAVKLAANPKGVRAAVNFANAAAGVAVGKSGTATVTMEEILARMSKTDQTAGSSCAYTLRDVDTLERMLRNWRMAGEKIVTTNGCFDILHVGHLKVLWEAKRQGDRLVVALNSDAAVRRLKGPERPVNNEQDRAKMLLALRVVDAVVIFDPKEKPVELTEDERAKLSAKARAAAAEAPMAVIRAIQPDVHVKGGDYEPQDIPEAIFAKRLVLVPLVDGHSTTRILERIREER